MALPVTNGTMLMCSFGLAPAPMVVLPTNRVIVEGAPVATIADNAPFVNIVPFGMCTSLANPITAAQTAAALGVLTPGVCTPVIPAPWLPGAPTMLVGNMPTLNNTSKCMCAYGGVISVTVPVAVREQIP
jgi:hypothetical protein